MRFIHNHRGVYYNPEAVTMIADDPDEKGTCIVFLAGGQQVDLPCSAEDAADLIAGTPLIVRDAYRY